MLLDSLNQNWKVKVKTSDNTRGTLVGRTGFVTLCGAERAENILCKAERCKGDMFVYRGFRLAEIRLYRV